MIIFRCNAGADIGLGHLMRCRTLANVLYEQGESNLMVGPPLEYEKSEDQKIFEKWIPLTKWESSASDSDFLVCLAQKYQAKWLVLDDYRIDEAYQLIIKSAGLKWLQFDGQANKPLWANIILNANPSISSQDYEHVLKNKESELLLGPRYALLRKEFAEVSKQDPSSTVRKVLVTFGGGDDRGSNEWVLSTLLEESASDIIFIVISGATNPSNARLKQWIDKHGKDRVALYIDPSKLAHFYASCDMAIMAGGTSTYEAACCGLPMILITIANNQIAQSESWHDFGVAIYLGTIEKVTCFELKLSFNYLKENWLQRRKMAKAGMELVSGLGAVEIARSLGCFK